MVGWAGSQRPSSRSSARSACLLLRDYQLSKYGTVLLTALRVIIGDIEQWARNRKMNPASETVWSGEEAINSTA